MKMKNIAVLFGGVSAEYNVSLQSAYAVLSHIDKTKYNIIPIGISETGEWFYFEGDFQLIRDNTWLYAKLTPITISLSHSDSSFILLKEDSYEKLSVDAVFPVLHGRNGEDGSVQGMLELVNIPIIGCKTLASALCMDKHRSHKLVEAAGVKVPTSHILTDFEAVDEQVSDLVYPLFVKPLRAGSSFGISKVDNSNDLHKAITLAREYDSIVVVEEMIDGFEVGCAIMGSKELIVGRVDEIYLESGFFDFNEKYSLKSSKIYMPARISEKIEEEIKATAKKIYQVLGCEGFARVDMFLNSKNEIVFNEVNTIPGFTEFSRYPNMMKGIGIDFEALIDALIRNVFE